MTVGENATLSCFSDLVVERVEWVLNGDIITNSTRQADLVFSPVQEYLHNREYVCRAVTAYGTLQRRVTVSVHSKRIIFSVVDLSVWEGREQWGEFNVYGGQEFIISVSTTFLEKTLSGVGRRERRGGGFCILQLH